MSIMRTRIAAALAVVAATGAAMPAGAQSPGDVIWSFEGVDGSDFVRVAPTVADDGTIYFPADDLYAFEPDGTMRWSIPLTSGIPGVASVGSGAVYAGAGPDVFAADPATGTIQWTFTDDSTGLMAGPSVGPDGNIYALFNNSDTGAVSLNPAGDLRWTLPGFYHNGGDGWGQVAFSSDRFYFADQNTPATEPLGGLVAMDFDGDILWSMTSGSSGGPRPRAAPNGNIYSQGSTGTLALSPDGTELWSREGGDTFGGPGIGPDSAIYVTIPFEPDFVSYDAQGNERWTAQNVFPLSVAQVTRPAVSPDNEVVVFGTTSGNGGSPLGRIVALDAADGSELWSITLDDGFDVYAPPAFSPDGQVVYVGVENDNGNGQLRAIRAQPGCPADLTGPGGEPDGEVTSADFLAYIDLFAAGDPQADLTGGPDGGPDGEVTSEDFLAYIDAFAQGCP